MNKYLFLLFGCLYLVHGAPSTVPKAEDINYIDLLDASEAPRLSLLGTVGTKSYFVDYSEERSWKVAKSYCASFGLQIATIETVEELGFLNGAFKDGVFDYTYWVAAKDTHTMSQFHWDHNGAPLTMDMEILTAGEVEPSLTCGAIAPYPNHPAKFELYSCSRTNLGVLCETK